MVTTRPIPDQASASASDLIKIIRDTFADLEDQLNQRAQIFVSTNGKAPAGLKRDDVLIISYKGSVKLLVRNGRGFDTQGADDVEALAAKGTNYLGYQTGVGAPALANFPTPHDWGFYYQSAGTPKLYLCYNRENNLEISPFA